ncbi:Dabb family protein [Clostridium facile]|uniref:Dabb family protein n=1 Tax=Clostridium facile TaxID=2763035 RepID=A0ABR7ISH1_9CLOT|nr:Dabb family protein [Clostridium facile]MBC5788028.1 Dabb family protein [Clostridium facile]
MVKHFVIWKLKDAFTVDQNIDHARKIKRSLEGLKGQIDGLVDIKVQDELLSSSSGTVLLDTTFVDEAALKAYQTNPKHLEVAFFVRSVAQERLSADYEC